MYKIILSGIFRIRLIIDDIKRLYLRITVQPHNINSFIVIWSLYQSLPLSLKPLRFTHLSARHFYSFKIWHLIWSLFLVNILYWSQYISFVFTFVTLNEDILFHPYFDKCWWKLFETLKHTLAFHVLFMYMKSLCKLNLMQTPEWDTSSLTHIYIQ